MPNLYPSHLTAVQAHVMRALYLNPFALNSEIGAMTHTHHDSVARVIPIMLDDETPVNNRLRLFYQLGYIYNLQSILSHDNTPRRFQNILELWAQKPYYNNREIADAVYMSESVIGNYTSQIYKWFGYTPRNSKKYYTARLEFYEYMGIFDTQRLAVDAVAQYKEVFNAIKL